MTTGKIPNDELLAGLYDWRLWARPKQLPPSGNWRVWLLLAGRGFGKTRAGAEWVRMRVESGRYGRIALVGETAADVRDVMVEGESGIMAISPPWCMPKYEPSKRRLTWPNGAIATTYSGDAPDQLRGPQHDTAWADEPAKWKYAQEAWDNLELGLRAGPNPQICATTTPKPISLIKELIEHPQTVVVRGSTYENIANLAPSFIEYILGKYEGTRLGRQELHAELLDDNPDALWDRAMIEAGRVIQHPDLVRVVVGVDPPGSRTGAECGIIVAGKGVDNHLYVLDDVSLRGSPEEWARAAITAYYKHQVDRVIGEVNNGGDMVESTLRAVDHLVSFKAVRASRGKAIRAEPVEALYEQGKAHHVGMFADLEDQLCQWAPGDHESPDRLDALVWAATELLLGETKKKARARSRV